VLSVTLPILQPEPIPDNLITASSSSLVQECTEKPLENETSEGNGENESISLENTNGHNLVNNKAQEDQYCNGVPISDKQESGIDMEFSPVDLQDAKFDSTNLESKNFI